nr:MAG TPA: hypothetical protein [Caudoviricetes sp.]
MIASLTNFATVAISGSRSSGSPNGRPKVICSAANSCKRVPSAAAWALRYADFSFVSSYRSHELLLAPRNACLPARLLWSKNLTGAPG